MVQNGFELVDRVIVQGCTAGRLLPPYSPPRLNWVSGVSSKLLASNVSWQIGCPHLPDQWIVLGYFQLVKLLPLYQSFGHVVEPLSSQSLCKLTVLSDGIYGFVGFDSIAALSGLVRVSW
jgi:hypothetical protein